MSRRDIFKLALILLVLAAALVLVFRIDSRRGREETEVVRRAVREAAVTCYAVEGAYPVSLDYLREHYQLSWDEDRYVVTYDRWSANILPDIYVTAKGAGLP